MLSSKKLKFAEKFGICWKTLYVCGSSSRWLLSTGSSKTKCDPFHQSQLPQMRRSVLTAKFNGAPGGSMLVFNQMTSEKPLDARSVVAKTRNEKFVATESPTNVVTRWVTTTCKTQPVPLLDWRVKFRIDCPPFAKYYMFVSQTRKLLTHSHSDWWSIGLFKSLWIWQIGLISSFNLVCQACLTQRIAALSSGVYIWW